MGNRKNETFLMKTAIDIFLFTLGFIFLAFIASTIAMFLAPQYFSLCIFERNCGGVDSQGLSCDISDPSNPCTNSTQPTCPSNVWDANNECCNSGQIDACGICDGKTKNIDRDGFCCSGELDASGACCYEGVNPWGICGESNLNGTIAFEANVTSEFSGILGVLLSSLSTLDEGQIEFVDIENLESRPSGNNARRLLSGSTCMEEQDSCSNIRALYTPSPSTSAWSSGTFYVRPSDSTDEGVNNAISLEKIEAILKQIKNCFCESISSILDAKPVSICGNGQCEVSEPCLEADDQCCSKDCPIILKQCASINQKECNGNGVCVSTTGLCRCWEGYSGDSCEKCADEYTLNQSNQKCLKHIILGLNSTDTSTWTKSKYEDNTPMENMEPPTGPPPPSPPQPPPVPPPPPPLPPIMWREVGKLYRDLYFEHGPSLSFDIEFNPTTHQVYLGFQDLGDPLKVSRPTIVKFDGKKWQLVGERGGASDKGSSPDPDPRYFFDYKARTIDGKEKVIAATFDLSYHKARYYEHNEGDDDWTKIVNFFVYYYEIMTYSGSIMVWDEGDFPLFAVTDEMDEMTHILQYNYRNQTWKSMQFGPHISNRRKFTFVRNKYNDQLYLSGCSNINDSIMYPRVYRFEAHTNKWENITKPNDVPHPRGLGWDCIFCALAFDGYGNPMTAHITTQNDLQTVVVLRYNEATEDWDQVAEIGKPDLPGGEDHYRVFWDGVRFAMDNAGNVYLYFRSHYFTGTSWPKVEVEARLWVVLFDKMNVENWSFWPHDFERLPGVYPLEQRSPSADSTLGHLAFDPDDIPYYAFCRESFRVSPMCPEEGSSYRFCGSHVQSRCVPTVYRRWHW